MPKRPCISPQIEQKEVSLGDGRSPCLRQRARQGECICAAWHRLVVVYELMPWIALVNPHCLWVRASHRLVSTLRVRRPPLWWLDPTTLFVLRTAVRLLLEEELPLLPSYLRIQEEIRLPFLILPVVLVGDIIFYYINKYENLFICK